MLGELRRRVVEDVSRVDFGRRDLERLGAVLLGQREVGVVEELQSVFILLVELVGERALRSLLAVRVLEGRAEVVNPKIALGQTSRAREDELGQERAAVC